MICKKCGKGSFYSYAGNEQLCSLCVQESITKKYCKDNAHILGKFVKYTETGQIKIVKCIIFGCCFEETLEEYKAKFPADYYFMEKKDDS